MRSSSLSPLQVVPALILLWAALLAMETAAQGIVNLNGGTITGTLTFGAGTSIVRVKNTAVAGGSLVFDIGAMATTSQPVVIEICGATLSGGAIIYFLGGSSVTGMKPAYVHMTNIEGTNSGLGFGKGTYPLYSQFIVTNSHFAINTGAATFSLICTSACTPSCLVFDTITLTNTILRFTNIRIDGALRNGLFPIRFNSFVATSYSMWLIDNSYIGNSFAMHAHSPQITANSVFMISGLTAVCDRFCISFEGTITIDGNSAYIMEKSTASADGHDLFFSYGSIYIGTNSLLLASGNYFITPRYAFSVGGSVTSGPGGVMSFVDNSLLGLPWHVSTSATCYAQCNQLGAAQLSTASQYTTAGLRSVTAAYPCNLRTGCALPTVGCFQALTDLTKQGTTTTGCCVCKAGGYGKYCLPVAIPFVPQMCFETVTLAKFTETKTTTLSQAVSASVTKQVRHVFNGSHSLTVTLTLRLTNSPVDSPSKTVGVTTTLNRNSTTAALSFTKALLPTVTETGTASVTISLTATDTNGTSWSRSYSPTRSQTYQTFTLNLTASQYTPRPTASLTVTDTVTVTLTKNVTVTKSLSYTPSSGYCIWDRSGYPMPQKYRSMQLAPFFPLAMTEITPGYNFTMALGYDDAFSGYNFNLSSLGQWQVSSVAVAGEATFALFYNSTTSDSALISVGPPTERYTNVLLRTAQVMVTFHCGTTFYTETFLIVILPRQPVVQQGVVDTVLAAALGSGIIVASPPVAAAAAWAMIFHQIMLCQSIAENSIISFTGLTIGDDSLKYLRGAVIANVLIVIGQAVLVMLIGGIVVLAARARNPKQRFMRALSVLQWPNVMHISIGALLLLTTAASVALISNAHESDDYLISLVGIIGGALYTVVICLKLYFAHQASKGRNRTWQVAQSLGQDHFVFGNYKRPWFAGYETANNLVIGIVAGLPPGTLMCIIQMWFIFFASFIILCIIAYFRPMKTLLSLVFTGAIQGLTFLAANAMIVAHYVPQRRSGATSAATVVLLMIPLVALLKAITDIVAFVMHGRTLFERLFQNDKAVWDLEDDAGEDDDAEEEMKPSAQEEADDLNQFLMAIDADAAKEKRSRQKVRTASAPATAEGGDGGSVNALTDEPPLNEDDIFKALKI